jgi:hypothetical protein
LTFPKGTARLTSQVSTPGSDVIFESSSALRDRIEEMSGRKVYAPPRIWENTTNFFNIISGDVLRLGGRDYYVYGDAKEGRFGMDDEPKPWVKFAFDLTSGRRKVIKLVFDEAFSTRIGLFLIKATRSAQKEAAVLDAVRGHPNFMQGFSVSDTGGNLVRILDHISGKSLFNHILDQRMDHLSYYRTLFPALLENLIVCIDGMRYVFQKGLHHGDIRNDHIFIESGTGTYKWIDFDYSVTHLDFDLWSIGNLIIFAAAGGLLLHRDVTEHPEKYPLCRSGISADDCSLYHKYRIANVRKVYPYISQRLNDICMRYAIGGLNLYEGYDAMIADLEAVKRNPTS